MTSSHSLLVILSSHRDTADVTEKWMEVNGLQRERLLLLLRCGRNATSNAPPAPSCRYPWCVFVLPAPVLLDTGTLPTQYDRSTGRVAHACRDCDSGCGSLVTRLIGDSPTSWSLCTRSFLTLLSISLLSCGVIVVTLVLSTSRLHSSLLLHRRLWHRFSYLFSSLRRPCYPLPPC